MPFAINRWKAYALFIAFLGFLTQSYFVFTDYSDNTTVRLSEGARRGLDLWRERNCQVCHQIHGFGGFLGPDLTNVTSRLDFNTMANILQFGKKQMPAFYMSEGEITDLYEYLTQIDKTGVGYLISSKPSFEEELNGAIIALAHPQERATLLRGAIILTNNNCSACHQLIRDQIGPKFIDIKSRKSRDEIRYKITHGGQLMPPYPDLQEPELSQIMDVFDFLARRRNEIEVASFDNAYKKFSLMKMPWFEYQRNVD
jgi:nitric oxide reductase subunit C